MFKKLLVALLGLASISYLYAFNVTFNRISDVFEKKLVGIHFFGGGNNYGGVIFVTNFSSLPNAEVVNLNGSSKKCYSKLEGYYYNPLHGSILYPLDENHLNFWKNLDISYYSGLEITGGFYTACENDENSIYGQITYKKNNKIMFSLIAGLQYDYTGNKIVSQFSKNLQVLNNYSSNVVGLIYDSSSGIGFVGGHILNGASKIVNYLNNNSVDGFVTSITSTGINNVIGISIEPVFGIGLVSNLSVLGSAALSKILLDTPAGKFFAKRTIGPKNLSLTTPVYNISKVLNIARKNAYKLCMGKWNVLSDLSKIDITNAGNIICIKGNNLVVKVYDDLTLDGKKTTIILKGNKNKLVFLNTQQGPGYLNVFVDNGEVLFSNNAPYNVPIDIDGKINPNNPVTSGYVFNGNIIVNGIMAGSDNNGNIEGFKHKFYYYGSLASLNTLGENYKRQNILVRLGFNTLDSDLIKGFTWQCTDIGKGTDGVNCSNVNDKYATSAFIIQKKQYYNPLLK